MFEKRPFYATEEYITAKLNELATAKKISLDIAYWGSDWSDVLYIVIQRVEGNQLSPPIHSYADHRLASQEELDEKLQVLVTRCSYMSVA